MEQSFENIKVGDIVIFESGGWYNYTIIDKVTRVTPKQFEVKSHRFRKKDGSMIGDNYRRCRLATDEDIAAHNKEQQRISLRNKVSKFFKSYDSVDSLTIEELGKIENIIKNKLRE
jgi:hypothetical protein|nr:MAG TPA: hypothetical protein [Caudoviricetes sp.]